MDLPAVNDVIIIGAGLAGKAAAIHLAKAGLRVLCIAPERPLRPPVGESLDWSAPDLLKAVGVPMENLVESGTATWKRHVTVRLLQRGYEQYAPSEWLAKRPWKVELNTVHVNRERLDNELLNLAHNAGTTFVADRVSAIERQNRRIVTVRTASGRTFQSKWFVDASGFATSLFGRTFDLPIKYYGPPKVSCWTYFASPETVEGTTLYMDPKPLKYLDWVWEIPIASDVVGVGYTTTGTDMKQQRDEGLSVDEIFFRRLSKFSHFEALMRAAPLCPINITSFRGRTYGELCGPNWIIIGEAAELVDPITSNGVTAALRHAAEAADLLIRAKNGTTLPYMGRKFYGSRARHLNAFLNMGTEKIVYEPAVRTRIGLPRAGKLYTTPAWMMNLVYARTKPRGLVGTLFFSAATASLRAGAMVLQGMCRIGSLRLLPSFRSPSQGGD